MKTWTRTVSFLAFAPLVIAGCEDKPSETKASGDAAVQEGPVVDPDLAEAMKSASTKKKGARTENDSESGSGPPQSGIFEPGAADAELRKGAPPKITLGSEGSAPRVQFAGAQPATGWKRNGSVDLSIRAGRNQLPVITADLAFEAVKPKPVKPAEPAGGADASAGAPIVAKIVKAGVAPGQAGAAELGGALAKLKGSRVGFRVLPSGASDDFSLDLANAAAKDLDSLLRPLSEVLAAVTMPFPDKPVGKDAFWMITSRETVMGVDVVSYRMVRLEELNGDVATLSLSIKRYAASSELALPGVPPDAKLEQFQSVAEGKLEVVASATLLPSSGNLRQTLVAMLTPPAGTDPSQRLSAQTGADATFRFPLPQARAKPAD
jgi:hypothetical protein